MKLWYGKLLQESFAARKARVFKRAVFNLAAYIDNNVGFRSGGNMRARPRPHNAGEQQSPFLDILDL